MNRQNDVDVIEGMRPTAWRPDGSPVSFEIVPAEPVYRPRVIGDDDGQIVSPLPAERTPRVQYIVTGSPIDEAVGFNRRVYPLALVVGVLVVTMALIFGASLSFWAAALYFGTAFGLTWLAAFVWDTARSPGGVELVNTLHLWAFLRREQEFRHNRYDVPQRSAPGWLRVALLAGAIGFSGLFMLLILGAVAMEMMPR